MPSPPNTSTISLCLVSRWTNKTFFFDRSGLFTLNVACLSSLLLKDIQGFSSAWRYASLRRLILQTEPNGFPLEGLWLIPDAYSILCGHCSRKFSPDRTKKDNKTKHFLCEIVSPCTFCITRVSEMTAETPVLQCGDKEPWIHKKENAQENKIDRQLASQRTSRQS